MAGFTQTHQTKIVNAFLLRFPFIYLFIAAWNTVPMLATIGALHFGASVKHELQLLSQNTECNRKCMFEPTSLRSIYFYLFYLLIFFCYSRFFDFVCRLHLNIMQSCLRVIFVFFFFFCYRKKVLKVEQWWALMLSSCTSIRVRYQFYCAADLKLVWPLLHIRSECRISLSWLSTSLSMHEIREQICSGRSNRVKAIQLV